jgi:hypothetical protein
MERLPELLDVAMAVMEGDGPLPASFLSGVEFAEMSDNALSGPGVGAHAFDQREVDVLLAVLGSRVPSQKHPCLPALPASMVGETEKLNRVGFHYIAKTTFPLPQTLGIRWRGA